MHSALIALADTDKRDALAHLVQSALFRVVTTASCTEARRRFPGRDFDVVFTEAPRKGEGGSSRVIHSCGAAVLVDPPDRLLVDGSLPAGFDARLSTPFDVDAVAAILDGIPPTGGSGSVAGEATLTGHHSAEGPTKPLQTLGTRMLGESEGIRRVARLIRCMAPATAPVLITGETGTGKEVVARQIHDFSRRSGGPFVAVNCGALSPTLMDSQLFGHERGSFSGAERRHRGVFERAHGGTLFLDEITEMPVDLQVKFLRVLEEGEFHRTGGEELVSVNVRTLAATNRDPEEAMGEGRLRADLYYRLRVLHLPLPPLRERGRDVELLAQAFLEQFEAQEGHAKVFTEETLACLRDHSWPGNVRELRNAVHTAYLMSRGREITPQALPREVFPGAGRSSQDHRSGSPLRVLCGTSIDEAERRLILLTLDSQSGNKTQAAKTLGISLKTLYNRLNLYESRNVDPTQRVPA